MIKYFEWGRKGGNIVATDRVEAINELNKTFPNNFDIEKEQMTVGGFFDIWYTFRKKMEPSESTKRLLEAVK